VTKASRATPDNAARDSAPIDHGLGPVFRTKHLAELIEHDLFLDRALADIGRKLRPGKRAPPGATTSTGRVFSSIHIASTLMSQFRCFSEDWDKLVVDCQMRKKM
jgi:hypothetical protein